VTESLNGMQENHLISIKFSKKTLGGGGEFGGTWAKGAGKEPESEGLRVRGEDVLIKEGWFSSRGIVIVGRKRVSIKR